MSKQSIIWNGGSISQNILIGNMTASSCHCKNVIIIFESILLGFINKHSANFDMDTEKDVRPNS